VTKLICEGEGEGEALHMAVEGLHEKNPVGGASGRGWGLDA
jgi:hypothetical protein